MFIVHFIVIGTKLRVVNFFKKFRKLLTLLALEVGVVVNGIRAGPYEHRW